MLTFLKTAAAAALLALAPTHAAAIELGLSSDGEGIFLDGDFEAGNGDKFFNYLAEVQAQGYNIEWVLLNSPGGDVQAGMDIAQHIRNFGLKTAVLANEYCNSICTLAFSAGVERYVSPTARIGVHSAYAIEGNEEGTGETPSAMATTMQIARLMKSYDTPDFIIGRLVATSGQDISTITPDEISESGWAGIMAD